MATKNVSIFYRLLRTTFRFLGKILKQKIQAVSIISVGVFSESEDLIIVFATHQSQNRFIKF